ncbi:MAG: hypothetical protein WDO70_12380 [Alphaproteobacteria bacterium]
MQKLDPVSAWAWLRSHEKLKDMRDLMGRMRCAAQTDDKMTPKMMRLMKDIAFEEDSERQAILAIADAERRHRQRKANKQLKRICQPPLLQPQKPKEDMEWLLGFFIGLALVPRPNPGNANR